MRVKLEQVAIYMEQDCHGTHLVQALLDLGVKAACIC